ncbi:prenylcysteine lyase domain-containing protein [Sarocladium implicatum]|nr:prenylcysteine lyase domain-containing protein [Sarocladium implicatum]
MRLSLESISLWLGVARAVSPEAVSDDKSNASIRNIAIIGAGAAGSSAAYHLQQFAASQNLALNVTIFEKTAHIGGRTLTVPVFDDPLQPVELGASIFVGVNHILVNATRDFGLQAEALGNAASTGLDEDEVTAIWDGESFVFQTRAGDRWWWEAAKMVWRYGASPYYAVQLMKKTVATFMELYEPPMFPFRSLTQRVQDLGLDKITGVTGEQFLADHKINEAFSRHIIQAATRVNYASNLAFIHGLETMVSFATDGAVAVEGGNWQIFDGMVARSGAAVHMNTTVTSIDFAGQEGKGSSPQYTITTKSTSASTNEEENAFVPFDSVIIASPWQYSDIKTPPSLLHRPIDAIPYTKLHVTLFASPLRLRPGFFGLKPTDRSPKSVYTTLRKDEKPQLGKQGVGDTGFYSISTLRTATNPKRRDRVEYLYKIFSVETVRASFLSDLLGAAVPESIVSENDDDESPVTWHHARVFHSYPYELPRVTFQDPIVGDGVYYTSGMESFISCMETSALMGMNVAKLIVDDLLEDGKKVESGEADDEVISMMPDEL